MFIRIKNENYGYAVATYGDYVAVTNPAIIRFDPLTASLSETGSIDFFRYNKSTDQHDFVERQFRSFGEMHILLCAESGSVPSLRDPLHTELNNTGSTANKDLEIDKDLYTSSYEDGFGLSIDMYNKLVVAGSPYYTQVVQTSASLFTASNALVDVFDLAKTEFTSLTQSAFVFSIENPDPNVTESFGRGVTINNSWIAVGSPEVSGSNGMVYIYKNMSTGSISGSIYDWELFQKIQASGSIAGAKFGWSLKLNKQSGSFSGSMVVGCGNPSSNQVFYFEYISGSWTQTYVFRPDLVTEYPLTFGNFDPYAVNMNTANAYGFAVSTFQNTVIIGEYLDRSVYEFSGSALYEQGSVSIYERCPTHQTLFELVLKTYGTSSIMKNNRLGYAVDIFDRNAVAGIPKINNIGMTPCSVIGATQQLYQCEDNLELSLLGQAMLLQKSTGSNEWGITNIFQKKKRYFSPYRFYGDSVSIGIRSMVVGAPMTLSGSLPFSGGES